MNNNSRFKKSLLVIIDMQRAFQLPGVQWECAGYDAAENKVQQLHQAHPDPAVWTQFIRSSAEDGAWQAYYDTWNQYRLEPIDTMWDLTIRPEPDDVLIRASTFGKWTTKLATLSQDYEHLTIAGVATECCVLSTVFPAVDAGKYVTVISDACAGATAEAHEQALNLMGMLAPMVTIATTAEVLKPS